MTGFADPGAVVYLWAWGWDESYRELVTGQDGTWTADYSNDDFNLETGMCGRAEVRDKIGNRTAVDWCVRSTHIVASESGNWFWTADYFPGLLDISIYEAAEEGAALLWHGQREADRGDARARPPEELRSRRATRGPPARNPGPVTLGPVTPRSFGRGGRRGARRHVIPLGEE